MSGGKENGVSGSGKEGGRVRGKERNERERERRKEWDGEMGEWEGRQWRGVHVQTLTKRYIHSESAVAMSLYQIRYVCTHMPKYSVGHESPC